MLGPFKKPCATDFAFAPHLRCRVTRASTAGCSDEESSAAFTLTSPAFQGGQALPEEYTCAGKTFPYSGSPPVDHVSPQLSWTAGPANTMSYAIVFKDVTLTTATPINELGYLFDDGYVGPCPSWSVAPGSPLLGMTPAPTASTDSYTFTVFALPTATITKPRTGGG
jgi:phosphatidylethanolamine-binding protein (PEBP) family uncharacterized protein